MARGYWEAKDTHDDLDAEIQAKFNRGYPTDNIIFEDSETAVLVQNGETAMRVDMHREGELHRLIRRFLDYELPEIEDFRKAQEQFKTDLPSVLESLRGDYRGGGIGITRSIRLLPPTSWSFATRASGRMCRGTMCERCCCSTS